MTPLRPAVLAVVGAGPKGIGVLERVCASAPELLGDRRLVVHLVDPHPPGGGRVWRDDQSSLLLMNSRAQDVTMFTDDTVQCEGPTRPGPSLAEWVAQVRAGELDADVPPDLAEEVRTGTPTTFHTRRLQGAYLRWCFRRVLDTRPATVEVRVHVTQALDLTEGDGGEQMLVLRDEPEPLRADAVVLTVGHLDAEPGASGRKTAEFARRHGGKYYPPAYTADVDLSDIAPGETVLVRGFGLAFMDLLALLTEGRGGRFDSANDGTLTYRPSGAEPMLHVGSRRGVPYRPKAGYALQGEPAQLPRFFTPENIDRLARRPAPVRFWPDLWPMVAKEIGWGYYTELFTGHPERVRMPFEEFAERYAGPSWASGEMTALLEEAVPEARDRLDLDRLDRPLTGLRAAGGPAGQVRAHVEAVLARCADPQYSADLGALTAMLSVFRHMSLAAATGKLDAASQVEDVDGWWFSFFSHLGSGPPAPRLRELLALERAGIVSFVGPDMRVEPDERGGRFLGGSPLASGTVVADTLVDAWLPGPDIQHTTNPLVRALHRRGRLGMEVLTGGGTVPTGRIHTSGIGGRVIDGAGETDPRLFALGPHTTLRIAGAFSRPRTNALGFRETDLVARQALAVLRDAPVTDAVAAS
ncbi:FAD/NAD(P)-binding protein [Streptomyces roseifaciens]|uniref:FAD/NAD(P)-binding protein n=1 Tax=Streptomyces roseifaciens TaxID=1488406 RepID=UPI000717E96E|nr:FAD/NAD(P)-binding protein [Streptomyces roseifaciens]